MIVDPAALPVPGRMLHIQTSRRAVLTVVEDTRAYKESLRSGQPAFRIDLLSQLSEEDLDRICPEVSPKCRIDLRDHIVIAETGASVEPMELFPVDSPFLFIFNQFNGEQTITEIAGKTAAVQEMSEAEALKLVLGVFLRLCEVRVCEPANRI